MVEETHIKSCRVEECFVETGTDSTFDESTAQDVLASKYDHLSFQSELISCKNLIKVIPHIPKHIVFGCYDGLQCLIGFARKDIENIFGETAKRFKVIQGRRSSKLCKVEADHNYHSSHGVIKSCVYIDDITRVPCVCAAETGGLFAYTPGGLIKVKFLEECISLKRELKQDHYLYCRNYPLQGSKNEKSSVPCKGHSLWKFIKECCSKCRCNKKCGSRIVQQGIIVKLQGKGGVFELEDLPPGAFVCEYVGEILTNTELHERNVQSAGNKNTRYQVLLDAGWGSKGVLKDEEAPCLDATVYGNVARFINHRFICTYPIMQELLEGNVLHFVAQISLFTTWNVTAMEELTWDYGINFHDRDRDGGHPMNPFHCHCGSPFCHDCSDMRRDVRLHTYVRRLCRV
ncbi:histone-lysine N-methyltransferase SUVR4 isoform X2 [Prunus yedoensis var. nudiflora]|uniref:Histone-lysine N-methyltransferase SUVR4 isoform X2 n=1 Tax=Prunus yedoensis var. nudiflora TaxID=2094558 RepID=A0A314UXF2_PRUYE|nr:histone-lysine N-methyltransferase SUVR4 isoform X2 [Prunus yedoensis var. nudiflora]